GLALRRRSPRRLRVRRTLVILPDPLVAALLVHVLERRVRDPMRAAALAVRVDGAVVRLLPETLRVLVRAHDRGGNLGLLGSLSGRHGRLLEIARTLALQDRHHPDGNGVAPVPSR